MTKVAITGHRPEKLGDVGWVEAELSRVLLKLSPELMYQGMAAGVDLLSALVAHRLGIPFVAVRPWAGHAARAADQDRYALALQQAQAVVNVSDSMQYRGPWQYHARNEYMVDHADTLVAVWDGAPDGGTAACVRYAQKQGLTIVRLDPIRHTTGLLKPQSPESGR